jgi:hypothetical protein
LVSPTNAGCAAIFSDAATQETARPAVNRLLGALLSAADGIEVDGAITAGPEQPAAVAQAAALLRSSHRFFSLDFDSPADRRSVALAVARVERWHTACSSKRPQLEALAAFGTMAGMLFYPVC